jgi:hypothetical protein
MQAARWESIPRDPFTRTYNSRLQPVEVAITFTMTLFEMFAGAV